MTDTEREAVAAIAEFLHSGGPPLAADDAAIAIVGALTAAGFEVVPADRLAGAVEALEHIAESAEHPSLTVRSTSYLGRVARTALDVIKER